MIRLDIEGYCQNCPAFEAATNRSLKRTFDDTVAVNIVVTCEHKDRCKSIHAYLKEETKEKNHD